MNNKRMKLVLGRRILEVIMNENSSFVDLQRNIQRGFPRTTKRQYSTDPIRIVEINLIPAVPSKTLHIKGVAKSRVKTYTPEIMFMNVQYEDRNTRENVTFMANDGEEYSILPINLRQVDCKTRCDCLDFYFRFAYWNHTDDSLQGPLPPPYRRKTVNYPPVNPMRVPGVCKHILKLVMALQEVDMLK